MSWTNVVGAGASLIGGLIGDRGGRRAADAQRQANERAAGQITAAGDQARADLAPYSGAGGWALGQQQSFLQGDYGAALASPFYKATLEEGFKGLDAGAAAGGNLWGGGTDADRMRFGQNAASSQLGNYYNALSGLSSQGLGAAQGQAQAGMSTANSLAGLQQNTGQAQASAYANTANSWNNALGGISGAFGQWAGNRTPGGG